jgi:UDP-glucose 4-epimerase
VGRPIEVNYEPARVGDVHESQADRTRLSTLFPDTRPVPLDEGLLRTVDWYRSRPFHQQDQAAVVG